MNNTKDNIKHIQDLIEMVKNLPELDENELDAIRKHARMIVRNVFDESSKYLKDLDIIEFYPSTIPRSGEYSDEYRRGYWRDGKNQMLNLLMTALNELTMFGKEQNTSKSASKYKIDKMIEDMLPEHKEILKKIWEHFLKNKEWPKGRTFQKEHGYERVKKAVAALEPIFIWDTNKDKPASERYNLTVEGVYAVEGSSGRHIELVLLYLEFQKRKFKENPDFEKVTSEEIKEELNLSDEDIRIMGELIYIGNLYGNPVSTGPQWGRGILPDIVILYETPTPLEFLLKRWGKEIERGADTHQATTPRPPPPHTTNIINIRNAANSPIQCGTTGSTQTVTQNINYNDVNEFVKSLEESVDKLNLAVDKVGEIRSDIHTIKSQLVSPKPKDGVIRTCLCSIKTILEGAAGGVLAAKLIGVLSGFGI